MTSTLTNEGRKKLAIRERLAQGAPTDLDDAELVALLLATGTTGADALSVAHGLLDRCGGLDGLNRTSLPELLDLPGVGQAKATRVLAAVEVGRRCACRRIEPGRAIVSSRQVIEDFAPRIAHLDREHFFVVLVDAKHRKIREHCVSVGTLDCALVHPREVFRPAVAASAAAVILVHNHPSGDPTPSAEDRAVTRRMAATAELLGLDLLDHVIIARQGCLSFRDAGEL